MTDERPKITPQESDATKYMMDAVNIHVQASRASGREKPGWVAIRLLDGKSPSGDLYDTRSDAIRFNGHDSNVFYVKVGKDTISFREALLVLQQNRQARGMGVVFQREQVVMPNLTELLAPYLPRTLEGLRDE
jgi:hypothetical protein